MRVSDLVFRPDRQWLYSVSGHRIPEESVAYRNELCLWDTWNVFGRQAELGRFLPRRGPYASVDVSAFGGAAVRISLPLRIDQGASLDP